MIAALLVLNILTLALLAVLWLGQRRSIDTGVQAGLRPVLDQLERLERALREELARTREESATQSRSLRDELSNALKLSSDSVAKNLGEVRDQSIAQARATREELAGSLKQTSDTLTKNLGEITQLQRGQLELLAAQLNQLTASQEARLTELRQAVEAKLGQIQTENARKLEEMRLTVDEKLQGALEKRLGESFKLVSERLELVHKGLGEMQSLATGVGDLKKVLTNVKTRGIWGEMQLGNLIEQILPPTQYAQNVATKPGSRDTVEYAIKLPSRDERGDSTVWLPVDAKFPKEDYERLLDALERADTAAVDAAGHELEHRLKAEARSIRDKYIEPPATADFAILFLPTEGLYAEALRRPGLADTLQRDFRVNIAGPTTFAALLNSLQIGFRSIAIQKRSGEVWQVLGAVKTEFSKFGDVMDRVQKKLQEASNVVDTAATRTRAIERRLRGVEALPQDASTALLDDSGDPSANNSSTAAET